MVLFSPLEDQLGPTVAEMAQPISGQVFRRPTTADLVKRQQAHLDARLAYYKKTAEADDGWQTIPVPQSPPKVPRFPPPPRRAAMPLSEGDQEPQSSPLKPTSRPASGRAGSRPTSSAGREGEVDRSSQPKNSLLERALLASAPGGAAADDADADADAAVVITPAMEALRQALVAQMHRVIDLFRRLDANGDGRVSAEEFALVLALVAPRVTAAGTASASAAPLGVPAEPTQHSARGAPTPDAPPAADASAPAALGEGTAAFGEADVAALFRLLDRDGSGAIDYRELHSMLRQGLGVALDAKLRVGAAGEIALEAKNRIALRSQAEPPHALVTAPGSEPPHALGTAPISEPPHAPGMALGSEPPPSQLPLAPIFAPASRPTSAAAGSLTPGAGSPSAIAVDLAPSPSPTPAPPPEGAPAAYSQLPSRPASGYAPRPAASLTYAPYAPSPPRAASPLHHPACDLASRAGSPPRSTSPSRSASPPRGAHGAGRRPVGLDLSVQIDRLEQISSTRPQEMNEAERAIWFHRTISWSDAHDLLRASRGGAHGAGTGLFADPADDDLGVVPLRREACGAGAGASRDSLHRKLLNAPTTNSPGPALIPASAITSSMLSGASSGRSSLGPRTRRVIAAPSRQIRRFENRVKVPYDYVAPQALAEAQEA